MYDLKNGDEHLQALILLSKKLSKRTQLLIKIRDAIWFQQMATELL